MKKYWFLTALIILLLTGCATNKYSKFSFDKTYNYKDIYQSTLQALNEMNYTVVDHDMEDGVIHAVNYSTPYTAHVFGLVGILPWIYGKLDYPRMSVVISKGDGRSIISINESASSVIVSKTRQLEQKISMWYDITNKKALLSDTHQNTKLNVLNIEFEWKNSNEFTITIDNCISNVL